MSVKVLAQIWQDSHARGGDLLVLLAVGDFARDDGLAYPSIATLAQKSRLSERQVQRAIRRLVRLGELSLTEGGGRGHPHEYTVVLQPILFQTHNVTPDKVSPIQPERVTTATGKGDICAEKGDAHVTRSVKNPKEIRKTKTPVRSRGRDPADLHGLVAASEQVFETGFWKVYPSRDGKRLEKQATKALFLKLTETDQHLVCLAAVHYAASRRVREGIGIKDPKRFLRDGQGNEPWRDWIEPEGSGKPTPTVCVGRVQEGYRLKTCGQPIAESERGKPQPLCEPCLAERARLHARSPPAVQTTG